MIPDPKSLRPAVIYDPHNLDCDGCRLREGNIWMLLESILQLAKRDKLVREDLDLSEFTGPMALMVLEQMREKDKNADIN